MMPHITFTDPFAPFFNPAAQTEIAQRAQEIFAQAFRIAAGEGELDPETALPQLLGQVQTWLAEAESVAADPATHHADGAVQNTLRLVLLVTGLDQWGLAYAQAFGLEAIPTLSHLISTLRTGLSPQAEAMFQQQFETLHDTEAAGIDFKVTLRREIHLALWHAMIASESDSAAEHVATTLGSLLLSLIKTMPEFGWRLVADVLAYIQIRCLSGNLATGDGADKTQPRTQLLLNSLSQALPRAEMDRIMAHATQVLLAWQQARRNAH